MKRSVAVSVLGMLGALGSQAWVSPAQACGGTFCDGGPTPMPVDQSGENILFVQDGDTIEAHIQIQYVGDPAQFSWVIPLQSVPDFSVGSEPLFQALLNSTVPTYQVNQVFDDCSLGDDGFPPGNNAGDDGAGFSDGSGGGETGAGEGGPDILLQETVGAYEITVLTGGSAEEVITWLDDNGYAQDPEAEPILAEYLAEGHVFGAVRLTGGSDTNEIHPIVLTFQNSVPCIPLRLTRIAAVDDMAVRSFFLGDARTVPLVYKHVLVNPLKIDWINLATNYVDVITMAVDAEEAGGKAFVTEYAGPSDIVPTFGVYDAAWDPSAFATADPTLVVDLLMGQGLYFCDFDFGNGCGGIHPLVQGLLDEFLPVPAGVDANDFYGNLARYADQIDMEAWDGPAFAAAMQSRIVDPGQHAQDILTANPYLSRLYTTISPGEMTADPEFHENPDLPDVTQTQLATQRFLCSGDTVWTMPDGREVFLPAGTTTWPTFEEEPAWVQPWEAMVEETPNRGAPIVLRDNNAAIDAALAAYNAAQGWPGSGGSLDGTAGGDTDSGGTMGGADTDNPATGDGGGGCGCRTTNPGGSPWIAAWAVLGVLGIARRRRVP
jgi:MYXO-CTERM domain-containing protein